MAHALLVSCKGFTFSCILPTSVEETQLIILIPNESADLVASAPSPIPLHIRDNTSDAASRVNDNLSINPKVSDSGSYGRSLG
jgi:hypothetical protein